MRLHMRASALRTSFCLKFRRFLSILRQRNRVGADVVADTGFDGVSYIQFQNRLDLVRCKGVEVGNSLCRIDESQDL